MWFFGDLGFLKIVDRVWVILVDFLGDSLLIIIGLVVVLKMLGSLLFGGGMIGLDEFLECGCLGVLDFFVLVFLVFFLKG